MNAITYTEAKMDLATTIRRVCKNRTPVLVTRKRADAVVMISQKDYDSLVETASLLGSPKNAKRLMASINGFEQSKAKRRLAK